MRGEIKGFAQVRHRWRVADGVRPSPDKLLQPNEGPRDWAVPTRCFLLNVAGSMGDYARRGAEKRRQPDLVARDPVPTTYSAPTLAASDAFSSFSFGVRILRLPHEHARHRTRRRPRLQHFQISRRFEVFRKSRSEAFPAFYFGTDASSRGRPGLVLSRKLPSDRDRATWWTRLRLNFNLLVHHMRVWRWKLVGLEALCWVCHRPVVVPARSSVEACSDLEHPSLCRCERI